MMWNAYVMGNSYESVKNHRITALLIAMLLSLTLLGGLNNVQGNITTTKLPNHSKFTNPPLIPVTPTAPVIAIKNCNTSSSAIKDGIECFDNKLYGQAKTIFIRVKKGAINNNNRELLFKSQMYLVFISIDEGEIETARKNIKHLFFLRANFTLKQYRVNNTDYSNIFEEIHQHGRNAGEREIDDISRIKYTRVEHCANDYCKDGVWQHAGDDSSNKNTNAEIACSIKGNCNYNIKCSITGDCNDDIKCSLKGTCTDNK